MKQTLLSLALLAFTVISAEAAAPVNDSVLKAVTLKFGTTDLPVLDLSTATAAATDPLINGASAGKTVWYRLQPLPTDFTPSVHLDIESTTGAGTVIVYRQNDLQNPFTSLFHVSTASFAAGARTRITVPTPWQEGRPSLIMFAGTGAYTLKVRAPLVANDYYSTAQVLTGSRGTVQGNNLYATRTNGEPNNIDAANSVWFSWTPAFSGAAAVDTNFSYVASTSLMGDPQSSILVHDTVIGVYREQPAGTLMAVASDMDGGWRENSRAVFTATSGTTYYIQVGTTRGYGQTPNPSGAFQLNYYQANTAGEIYFAHAASDNINNGVRYLTYRDESESDIPFVVARRYAGNLTGGCLLASVPGSSTAAAGSDYQSLATSVSFTDPAAGSDNSWVRPFAVTIYNDSAAENSEVIAMGLSNPSGGATIETIGGSGTPFFGGLMIMDDDEPQSPTFQMMTPVVRVKESDTWINLMAQRHGSAGGHVTLAGEVSSSSTASFNEYNISMAHSVSPYQSSILLGGTVMDDNVFEADEIIYIRYYYSFYASISATIIIEDDDAFIPTPGRLCTALRYSNSTRAASLYASISAAGIISGKLTLQDRAVSFVMPLNDRGKGSTLIPVTGRSSLLLRIEATDANGGFRVVLEDSLSTYHESQNVVLQNYAAKVNPCPEAGLYTFAGSDGCASVNVAVTGTASVAGRTRDGTAFTMTAYVDGDGALLGAVPLYGALGMARLSCWSLPLLPSQVVNGYIDTFRPARVGDSTKLAAAFTSGSMSVARYTPAAKVGSSLEAWAAGTGKATLTGGPLMNTLTKALTVTPTAIVPPVDAEKLKITVLPKTGLFSGSFILPGTTKVQPFYGALIQESGMNGLGRGVFFDGLKHGTITIGKP